jgi:hypothetical protein
VNTITLSSGRVLPLPYVSLDVPTQRFYYGPLEVTDFLSPSQKRTFLGFDVEAANRAASDAARAERGLPPVPDNLPTSTVGLWLDGIGADVTQAAEDVRDFAGIGPENAGRRSPLFWTAVAVGVGWLLYQVGAFAWIRKKLTA